MENIKKFIEKHEAAIINASLAVVIIAGMLFIKDTKRIIREQSRIIKNYHALVEEYRINRELRERIGFLEGEAQDIRRRIQDINNEILSDAETIEDEGRIEIDDDEEPVAFEFVAVGDELRFNDI